MARMALLKKAHLNREGRKEREGKPKDFFVLFASSR
jgi:hypothetical protein